MRDSAPPRLSATYLVLGWVACLSPAVTAIARGASRGAQAALVVSILWAAATGFVLLRVFPKGRIVPIFPAKFGVSDAHAGRAQVRLLCIFAAGMVWAWLHFAGR